MSALIVSRMRKLESLRTHAYYAAYFKKLSKATVAQCETFIAQNGALDADAWQTKVNREKFGTSTREDGMASDLLTACREPV